MADNVLVIPATIKVGTDFPPYLPLADGNLKPSAECTRDEVREAVAECRTLADASRARLEAAYREHVKDVELLAQVSAYLEKFDQWSAVREGAEPRELLWQVEMDR
jgi:hypothetical protein